MSFGQFNLHSFYCCHRVVGGSSAIKIKKFLLLKNIVFTDFGNQKNTDIGVKLTQNYLNISLKNSSLFKPLCHCLCLFTLSILLVLEIDKNLLVSTGPNFSVRRLIAFFSSSSSLVYIPWLILDTPRYKILLDS